MEAFCYLDTPQTGLMNMAIDDAMLEHAGERRAVLLRLYGWTEPTLSLGYFQRAEERALHSPSGALPMVRRATGGGAIVHHHDLTYALAVPQASSRVGAAPAIYNAVHSAVVEWLSDMGLEAQQWREPYNLPTSALPARAPGKSEFLCFQRRSEGDVVVGDHKILGSAQRRNKVALLQHGSLLIATSPHAPTLSGLQEILPDCGASLAKGRQFAEELVLRVQRAIDVLLGVRIKWNADLSQEMHSLGTVKVAKFEAPAWQDRV